VSEQQQAGLVESTVTEYLALNPSVDQARQRDARLAADWHLVRELLHVVDGHLRGGRAPHQLRREVVAGVLAQAFGTPEGRAGAELMQRLAQVLVMPSAAECTVAGVPWRYEGGEWKSVDTHADGE
jgi:hypothetical protein